jgi:hypothetical protein
VCLKGTRAVESSFELLARVSTLSESDCYGPESRISRCPSCPSTTKKKKKKEEKGFFHRPLPYLALDRGLLLITSAGAPGATRHYISKAENSGPCSNTPGQVKVLLLHLFRLRSSSNSNKEEDDQGQSPLSRLLVAMCPHLMQSLLSSLHHSLARHTFHLEGATLLPAKE